MGGLLINTTMGRVVKPSPSPLIISQSQCSDLPAHSLITTSTPVLWAVMLRQLGRGLKNLRGRK